MNYSKPEIVSVESASSTIRSQKQTVMGFDSNVTNKYLTINAYEADE